MGCLGRALQLGRSWQSVCVEYPVFHVKDMSLESAWPARSKTPQHLTTTGFPNTGERTSAGSVTTVGPAPCFVARVWNGASRCICRGLGVIGKPISDIRDREAIQQQTAGLPPGCWNWDCRID